MPWRELSVMDAKLRFIGDCLRGDDPMTVLCERHGSVGRPGMSGSAAMKRREGEVSKNARERRIGWRIRRRRRSPRDWWRFAGSIRIGVH